VTGQEAGDHLDELSRKYHDEAYPPDNSVRERMMPWIGPSRQTIVDQTASSIDRRSQRGWRSRWVTVNEIRAGMG